MLHSSEVDEPAMIIHYTTTTTTAAAAATATTTTAAATTSTMGVCLTIVTNLLVKSTTTAGKYLHYTIIRSSGTVALPHPSSTSLPPAPLAHPPSPCQSSGVCVWNIQLRTAALSNTTDQPQLEAPQLSGRQSSSCLAFARCFVYVLNLIAASASN